MKRLFTKQDLDDYDISVTFDENGEATVIHKSSRNKLHVLKPIAQKRQYKYFNNRYYLYYSFRHSNGKRVSLLAHRVIYIAYHGSIPEDKEVDHVDNNSLNNNIHNLKLLTHQENIAKKIWDNPDIYKGMNNFFKGNDKDGVSLKIKYPKEN